MQSIFLLASILLLPSSATSLRLSRSSQSSSGGRNFPEDLFASPAYHINWNAEPITNSSALQLIEQEELDWQRWREHTAEKKKGKGKAVERGVDVRNLIGDDSREILPPAFTHHLLRPSESIIYLCSIPSSRSLEASTSSPASADRVSILQSGLEILEPLKSQCLFRTVDWFTYSFCHGTEVRQFRALPGTNGPNGTPAADPTQESYILGRFTPNSEKIYPDRTSDSRGGSGGLVSSQSHASTSTLTSSSILSSASDTEVRKSNLKGQAESEAAEDGAELVEVLRFSSSGDDLAERYLSQKWGGGTRCKITMEPRETEVQFHCNPKIPHARISLIKETTTCAYVLIIETPRLCSNPAFSVGKEEKVSEIACRAIVPDGWKKGEGEIASEEWSGKEVLDSQSSVTAETFSQSQEDSSPSEADSLDPAREQPTVPSSPSTNTEAPYHEDSSEDTIDISENYYVIALDEEGNYVVESVQDDGPFGSLKDLVPDNAGLEEVMEFMFDLGDVTEDAANQEVHEADFGQEREKEAGADLGRAFSDQLADILERHLNSRTEEGAEDADQERNEAVRREVREQMRKLNNVLGKASDFEGSRRDGQRKLREEKQDTLPKQDGIQGKERYARLGQQARDKYAARKSKMSQNPGEESPEVAAHRAAHRKLNPQATQLQRSAPGQQTLLQPKSMKKEPESFAEKVGRMYREKEEKERKEKEQLEMRRKVEL